ncbi:hypothetical protein JR316_0009451 [Psilocybe cubensis]|uniref:Uncharacterized protein n=1 Tax=Psilocybe cubensis TaxID=181762 RepID=A0ACB8GTM0_PSICU|nr:hypothetical protein JR316_0009451 [Psilocybe cubensis]KAH9478988.1 hypothetical protein JR316_0009451 [Psilocybe cubensis]
MENSRVTRRSTALLRLPDRLPNQDHGTNSGTPPDHRQDYDAPMSNLMNHNNLFPTDHPPGWPNTPPTSRLERRLGIRRFVVEDIEGYHYPLALASKYYLGRTRRCRAYADRLNHNKAPEVHTSVFSMPIRTKPQRTIISVDGDAYRYLIVAYYNKRVIANPNLLQIFPSAPWRGELLLFSLGKVRPFLTRPVGPKILHQQVIRT